jgi:hypothetical protein
MRRRRLAGAVCAALALAVAAPALAEPAAGQGVGTYTCSEASRAIRGDHSLDLLYFSWAQGWMTGWNLAQMNANLPTVDLTALSLENQRAFIKAYCAQHSNGLYMDAVYKLYQAMKPSDQR